MHRSQPGRISTSSSFGFFVGNGTCHTDRHRVVFTNSSTRPPPHHDNIFNNTQNNSPVNSALSCTPLLSRYDTEMPAAARGHARSLLLYPAKFWLQFRKNWLYIAWDRQHLPSSSVSTLIKYGILCSTCAGICGLCSGQAPLTPPGVVLTRAEAERDFLALHTY